jgi:multiple sugar transport system substrate-binding protein
VDMAAVRKDTRWQLFADIYQSAGRYVPVVPDWTPFRQDSADTFNAIVANCGSDPKAELDKLAATFDDELAKQGAKA